MAVYTSPLASKGSFPAGAPPSLPTHTAPAGTFLPGTKVQVGHHRVIIDRYLSEGGFAHVYVVHLPHSVDGKEKAVLKRVAVPDKDHLTNMRTEVETMKRLRGHKHIVKYIDSHASQLKGGGYEVFLLMEFCEGGGLIDFMNTRLQNRLTEPEILKIFTDVAEGVAAMHYLTPPLLHRDLKVENVLISKSGSSRIYKLCDFGSAAPPRPAATTAAEGRLIEEDVQRHTTLQYRSPEMIDVYRKQPIDEKSDIWALGVFLYKLCYYTTPFEEVGQMAILNARFKFPGYPRFSDQLKLMIASMLRERASDRPNIYQVLQKACQLDGRELPVTDIYAHRSRSEGRKDQILPQTSSSQSKMGATLSPPTTQETAPNIPHVEPMRRGRPTNPVSNHGSAKPSPSPLRIMDSADPFAALDGSKGPEGDELSSRFPTLDQFALMTDKGSKFAFDSTHEKKSEASDPALAQRVTNALADDAFARPPSPTKPKPVNEKAPTAGKPPTGLERKSQVESKEPPGRASMPPATTQKTAATVMVSTGTMTSPSPPPLTTKPATERPIYRFPSSENPPRSASPGHVTAKVRPIEAHKSGSRLANLLRDDARRSQPVSEHEPRPPTSSRPSLEGGRPTMRNLGIGVHRSRSLNFRSRPVSLNIGARPTHTKDKEILGLDYEATFSSAEPDVLGTAESDTNITSDVDFLKAREEEGKEWRSHHKRLNSATRHAKRASLPSIAMTGTKLLAGRFGEAFKKFESNSDSHQRDRSVSPSRDLIDVLTPIAGSEATDLSDDRPPLDETEDLSPEMKRELEKRRLEAEERRVANAAAEYRQRLAARGSSGAVSGEGVARAASIQNKVKSLLRESEKPPPKTAAGYGRFTDPPSASHQRQAEPPAYPQSPRGPGAGHHGNKHVARSDQISSSAPASTADLHPMPEVRAPRPVAPPKPKVLRTGHGDGPLQATNDSAKLGHTQMSPDEDWEATFTRRYPSLSGLEMVEREIDMPPKTASVKTKEV